MVWFAEFIVAKFSLSNKLVFECAQQNDYYQSVMVEQQANGAEITAVF